MLEILSDHKVHIMAAPIKGGAVVHICDMAPVLNEAPGGPFTTVAFMFTTEKLYEMLEMVKTQPAEQVASE